MSAEDKRQCGFCLGWYVLNRGCLEVCPSCESRHSRSKHKKVKTDKPDPTGYKAILRVAERKRKL